MCALYNLPELPIFDSSTPTRPYNREKIRNTTFYYVTEIKNNKYNNLKLGWMSGYRLKGHKNDVVINAYREPKLAGNPFREIIDKLMKEDLPLAKEIINIFIGVMSINTHKCFMSYKTLTNSEDEGAEILENPVSLECGLFADEKFIEPTLKNKDSMLPISIMIIDYSVKTVMEKIAHLKKLDNDVKIRAIKNDCIQFKSQLIKYEDLQLDPKNLMGWKKEDVKLLKNHNVDFEIDNIKENFKDPKSIKFKNITDWEKLILRNSVCFDAFAGTGKTYTCDKKILPVLKKHNKTYCIISATHCALTEYYDKDENAHVIHYYTFNSTNYKFKNEFKQYDYIIIDESGRLEMNHLEYIWKNRGINQKIIFLGDKDQMLGYGSEPGQTSQLNYFDVKCMFDIEVRMTKNFRNNYTTKEYNDMKLCKYQLKKFEKKMINRISRLNITHTRKTMDKVNKIIIDRDEWTDEFGGLRVKKDGRLIAEFTDNKEKRKHFNDIGMYNSIFYNIEDYDDENITLSNDSGKQFNITEKNFKNMFNYGYAITSFRVQGMSILYENMGIWDWDKIKLSGREFYTVLSRVKTKINIKTTKTKSIQNIKHKQDIKTDEDNLDFGVKNMTLSFNDF
jgi:hypothetical protein